MGIASRPCSVLVALTAVGILVTHSHHNTRIFCPCVQEAPQTNFIACVSALRPFSAGDAAGEESSSSKLSSYIKRWRQNSQSEQHAHARFQQDAYALMAGTLCHEPQVPPRLKALMASEAKLGRSGNGYLLGFNSVHVWKQLHDLQVLVSHWLASSL